MSSTPNWLPTEAIEARRIIEQAFNDSIIGIYLYGSAVEGGLQKDSDVDVFVTLNRKTTVEERKTLVNLLMRVSGEIGNSLSMRPLELTIVYVPVTGLWQPSPSAEFMYGEWLREDFTAGVVPEPFYDPDLMILFKKVRESSVILSGQAAFDVFETIPAAAINNAIRDSLPNLLSSIRGDERNVLLTLARMWFTVATGAIAPKDKASQWAEEQLPVEESELLTMARMAYLGEVIDVWQGKDDEVDALANTMKLLITAFCNKKIVL